MKLQEISSTKTKRGIYNMTSSTVRGKWGLQEVSQKDILVIWDRL